MADELVIKMDSYIQTLKNQIKSEWKSTIKGKINQNIWKKYHTDCKRKGR